MESMDFTMKFGSRTAFALAAFSMASSAYAADLAPAPRLYTKAPPPSPTFNWSGLYVGAHGGYGNGSNTSTVFDPTAYTPGVISTMVVDPVGTTAPFDLSAGPHGGFGGLQIGYNWQGAGSPWVFGLEADASFGLRGEDAKPFAVNAKISGDDGSYTGVASLRQTIDAFGTVRGRIGYSADRFMLYATGGLAWASIETKLGVDNVKVVEVGNFSAEQLAALSTSASSTDARFGYAVGAGGEWAFDRNWSIKAEYIYLGFDSGSSSLSIPGATADASKLHLHTVKGGINYRF
jgi:outer membrane immunogenic protein